VWAERHYFWFGALVDLAAFSQLLVLVRWTWPRGRCEGNTQTFAAAQQRLFEVKNSCCAVEDQGGDDAAHRVCLPERRLVRIHLLFSNRFTVASFGSALFHAPAIKLTTAITNVSVGASLYAHTGVQILAVVAFPTNLARKLVRVAHKAASETVPFTIFTGCYHGGHHPVIVHTSRKVVNAECTCEYVPHC